MHTIDITKTGIKRSFLRKCEKYGLINPKRIYNPHINNEDYIPREYTQDELELVWNAYIYREKIGLTFIQIKELWEGKTIPISNSITECIKDCERQIEELQVLVEFMKYVKGLGFIPMPPKEVLGSEKIKDYLSDFIEYIDNDKKLQKALKAAEYLSTLDTFEQLSEEKIESLSEEFIDEHSIKYGNAQFAIIENIKKQMHLRPDSDEIQTNIQKLYCCHKELTEDEELTVWDFTDMFSWMIDSDSDVSTLYKKIFGEETIQFIIKALNYFLVTNNPRIIKIIEKNKGG